MIGYFAVNQNAFRFERKCTSCYYRNVLLSESITVWIGLYL